MTAAMAREEGDALAFECSCNDGFGGIAERRFHLDFFAVGEAFHRIEAASTDDANGWVKGFVHAFLRCLQNGCSLYILELDDSNRAIRFF